MRIRHAMLLGALFVPLFAFAASDQDIYKEIQQLLAQLQALQQQIAVLESASVAPASSGSACPTLTRVLSKGMRGDDVSSLQRFLVQFNWLANDSVTGYFGPLTEAAMKKWQLRYGVSGETSAEFGVVEATTRLAITERCKNNTVLAKTCTTYQTPTCRGDEHLEGGSVDSKGCYTAKKCVKNAGACGLAPIACPTGYTAVDTKDAKSCTTRRCVLSDKSLTQVSEQKQRQLIIIDQQNVQTQLSSLQTTTKQELAQSKIPDTSANFAAGTRTTLPPQLVPSYVTSFFDTFDANRDNKLSIEEGALFFYWVRGHIQYRYDDENTIDPGYLVGDGRAGDEYRQSPAETLSEGAGDCEDMATLEVAFYRYWGIPAYVAGVDSTNPGELDHAVAMVKIEGSVNEFIRKLGDLVYWEFEAGDPVRTWGSAPVIPGVYMLVDNAFSDNYGYVTDGVAANTFNIYDIVSLEGPYGLEWVAFGEGSAYDWTN